MIKFLKESYCFRHVILFAHGNSSNDIAMMKLAKDLKNNNDQSLGSCFWVGERTRAACYSLPDVDTLQAGVGRLAHQLKNMGWRVPGVSGRSKSGILISCSKFSLAFGLSSIR